MISVTEPYFVALHEQFDAEHAPATEIIGDGLRDLLRARQGLRRHRLRLPDWLMFTTSVPVLSCAYALWQNASAKASSAPLLITAIAYALARR